MVYTELKHIYTYTQKIKQEVKKYKAVEKRVMDTIFLGPSSLLQRAFGAPAITL